MTRLGTACGALLIFHFAVLALSSSSHRTTEADPSCDIKYQVPGKACTNIAHVRLLPTPPNTKTLEACCAACADNPACGAWTFHGNVDSCTLANASSVPGKINSATCGSKMPFPTAPPTPGTPIFPHPPGLQEPSMTVVREDIMTDPTGFLRDPSSPIQNPTDGLWHAWVVWVDPKYGQEGWSGFIKHFYTKDLNSSWIDDGFALNHSTNPLAFDHLGMCSPGAQYDPVKELWYLFYTGATPIGTTGYPPRPGGSPMDNLSAQGVAVATSPHGPWERLGIVAPGGLAWGANGTGGGFRPNRWNGLRVDSGRALIVNKTRLYSTKGIGNGTKIPDSNPTGMYQALQGVFFPNNPSSWDPPYHPFAQNPVTRAGPTGNSYTRGGAENCEFYMGPDGYFHCGCSAHGAAYPGGNTPHYIVHVIPSSQTGGDPIVKWQFVGFIKDIGASEPTPVYEDGPPGDEAKVRFFIARSSTGIDLMQVHWLPVATVAIY